MPKVYVEGLHDYYETEDADPDKSVICVRWGRETGDVQVVTRLRDAEVFFSEDSDAVIPAKYGWHVELDRRGINELIRNLRRARDQAFGRDE